MKFCSSYTVIKNFNIFISIFFNPNNYLIEIIILTNDDMLSIAIRAELIVL